MPTVRQPAPPHRERPDASNDLAGSKTAGSYPTAPAGGFDVSEAAITANIPEKRSKANQSPMLLAVLPALVLFSTATILFWLSKGDMAGNSRYWEIFVPVVALISLISGWSQAYLADNARLWYAVKQIIHWGALIGLLYIINSQGIRELLSEQQYTATILYLLAFTTLLAAIHVDIKLVFFAVFLVFCAFLIAVPADNPTLMSIGSTFGIADAQDKAVVITSGVAVIGFIASLFILIMMRGALTTKRIAAKRKA
jgi:hypothetical protein